MSGRTYTKRKRSSRRYSRNTRKSRDYRGTRSSKYGAVMVRSGFRPKYGNRAEKKVCDVTTAVIPFGGTSTNKRTDVVLLNGIQQGTAYNQRVGGQVTWKSIFLKFRAHLEHQTNDAIELYRAPIRVMVVYDRSPNGVVPLITDIIHDPVTPAALGANSDIFSFNLANRQRFVVIWDKTKILGPFVRSNTPQIVWAMQEELVLQKYKKLNIKSTYGDAGATHTSLKSGAFWLVVSTNYGATTESTQIKVIYNSRMRFTDV